MRRVQQLKLFVTGVLATLVIFGLGPAGASSANISHAYHSSTAIPKGSLVSLDPKGTDLIDLANNSNGVRLLGVAVTASDSLLAVNPSQDSIQVATSGVATTLVSTLNGNIQVGDQVAVSPFNGVGMKATAGSYVVGLAQTNFNASSQGTTTQTVTDKQGRQSRVQVGYLRLNIAIGIDNTTGGAEQLNSLQKVAKSLTGHTISTLRVVLGLVVALIALTALIALIYASIYGSIISLGRNPLAKYAVFRALASVLAMAVLITVVAGGIIFLLLH